jgi:hypothetical protein
VDREQAGDADFDERQESQQGAGDQSPSNDSQAAGDNNEDNQQGRQDNQGRGQEGNQNNEQFAGQGEREGQPNATPARRGSDNRGSRNRYGGLEQIFRDGGGRSGPGGPITGGDFRDWADRMRDVEDMLDDSELSAEVARIRDRAQDARIEFKRHSRPPDWTKLQDIVAEPLRELRQRIAEEIRRKESPDAVAPIDRDSAPAEFADQIRLYYQRLGSGE